MRRLVLSLSLALLALTPSALHAQFSGTSAPANFHDTSMLKPPAGSKVAIIVFEDLGCPACAHDHAIEQQAAQQNHVPLIRYDFPIPGHIWTFDGAVCARYLQDHINPRLADEYRSAVFAAQASIFTKDDLQHFTQRWMQQHNLQMPFVMDPNGALAAKVKADYDLGLRLNVQFTPTIVVVTRDRYQIVCGTKTGTNDPHQIAPVVQAALTQTSHTK